MLRTLDCGKCTLIVCGWITEEWDCQGSEEWPKKNDELKEISESFCTTQRLQNRVHRNISYKSS